MKIAYLIDYDITSNNGVIQKILQQSSQWAKKGHTVYFVSLKRLNIYDQDQNIIYKGKSLNIKLGRLGTAINLLYTSFFAYKLFQKIDFDIIYMRYRLYMPFFTKVLKRYHVVMEINSDDVQEYKLHSKLTHLYNKYTRDFLLKHIDVFINVSESEGVPVSIMEAMSCHIPIIAPDVGGIKDMVIDEYNGILLSGDPDINEIAVGLEKIEYFKNSKIRENAYALYLDKYNAKRNYEEFINDCIKVEATS